MIGRIATAMAVVMCCLTPHVFGEVTNEVVQKAIDTGKLVHPYLYFSEVEKPVLFGRIADDPELSDILSRMKAEANRLLYTPVPDHLPVQTRTPRFSGGAKRWPLQPVGGRALPVSSAAPKKHDIRTIRLQVLRKASNMNGELRQSGWALAKWILIGHQIPVQPVLRALPPLGEEGRSVSAAALSCGREDVRGLRWPDDPADRSRSRIQVIPSGA